MIAAGPVAGVTISAEWLIAAGTVAAGILAAMANRARGRDERDRDTRAQELARIVAEHAGVKESRDAAIADAVRYRAERDEALEDRDQERKRTREHDLAWQQRYAWQASRCEERESALVSTLEILRASLLDEVIRASAEDMIAMSREHVAGDHPELTAEVAAEVPEPE